MAQVVKTIFNYQISRFCRQHMNARLMCGYNDKDLTKHVHPSSGPDFLLQDIKHATNTKNVLDMVSMHNNIMNNKHIIQAFKSIFSLQKSGNSDLSTKDILRHPDFTKLCRKLRNHAGSIDLYETIDALKVVSYVGVASNSTIVQVLLQLVRHNINHLSLQQIIFLDFLLSQFDPSPLIDALKMALPIVFEIHLPIKMDYDNISQLSECLFFASRHRLSNETLEKITNALEKCRSQLDARTAKSIIWSICDMEANPIFEPLMKTALNAFMVHLDELNYMNMESTLSKLIFRYSKKSPYFYDEVFFDSCANYVIDNDLGFKHSVYLLRKFSRVGHANNFLLDYMCKKVQEDPGVLLRGDVVDIYSIVVSVAMTDYRPVGWDVLKEYITKIGDGASIDQREIIWLKFASSLCLLDIYKLDVLHKVLNESYINQLFRKTFMSDYENFLTVWQCITIYKPEFSGLLPARFGPEFLINKFKHLFEYPLEGALHKGLGGEKYIKTGLFSKLGHKIDHLIVFRKGGFPVAMNYPENMKFIEDLQLPADHQIVLIHGLNSIQYTLNNKRIKYSTIFSLRILESRGYNVVPIDLELWESLQEFERIPYVMQAVREKIDCDLKISEGVI